MKSKKLLAAALAAVLTLAGCGTTVLSAEETKELLTLSQKTMATVESMAAEMTMEMDMSMGEETAETTTVAKILTQQNPLRMQMNLSATLEDGTEAQNMQMYAEEEDGKLRTYVLAADTWYSQTMELGGLAQYNAEENVTLYLSNLADFSATATEKINDTEKRCSAKGACGKRHDRNRCGNGCHRGTACSPYRIGEKPSPDALD